MSLTRLLTPGDVAELLGVSTHTLAIWRSEARYGLPYVKVGRLVRYREDDVDAYIGHQTHSNYLDDFGEGH